MMIRPEIEHAPREFAPIVREDTHRRAALCNQFLLVSLAATMWVIVEVLEAYDTTVFALTGIWFPPMDYLLGAVESTSFAMFWLVFLPPRFYRNWIESHDRQLERTA